MHVGKRVGDKRVVIDNFVFDIIKITNKGNLLLKPIGKLQEAPPEGLVVAEEKRNG